MGEIVDKYLFRRKITDANILGIIASQNPEFMGETSYREISGYLAEHFRLGVKELSLDGKHTIARLYSHAANVLEDIVDDRSLRIQAYKHESLFTMLYLRDDKFQRFIDKFMPDLMIVQQVSEPIAAASKPREVEAGKIIPFERQ